MDEYGLRQTRCEWSRTIKIRDNDFGNDNFCQQLKLLSNELSGAKPVLVEKNHLTCC
jgi:hypothetical protein